MTFYSETRRCARAHFDGNLFSFRIFHKGETGWDRDDLQDEENLENLSSRMDVKKGLIRDLIAASISKLFTKKRYLEIIIKICPSMKMEKLLEKLGNQVTRCIIISVYFSL